MSVSKEGVSATDIEQAVYDTDEIRIVIRAPQGQKFPEGYKYQRKAASTTNVKDWLESRILPLLGNCQAVVIDGNGQIPHGRTKLETVRQSYVK